MRSIKFYTLLLASGLFGSALNAQSLTDSQQVAHIATEVLLNGKAYQNLEFLCKKIGHRLSGSTGEAKTRDWAMRALKEAGADTVWLQPVMVPKWTRGPESLKIKKGKGSIEIPMLSLGNSEGTKGKVLEAEIVCFETMEALKNAPEASLKGKIAFLNYPFPAHFPCTFDGYSEVGGNRYNGPAIASKKGAVAFVIRSLSTGVGNYDLPHTGVMSYGDATNKIPAIAIGNAAADSICKWVKQDKIKAALKTDCGMQGDVMSYNVIGEIKGATDRYITVGGHYDSWDVGEGAHDDGAGCVQSIEIIRCFKQLNIKPKNTIRAVLFANEENGAKGGRAYADSAVANKEVHVLALESDAGGFSPRGFSLEMDESEIQLVSSWKKVLLPLGLYDFDREGGGVDIDPLRKKLKTPLAGLMPDTQRYFDVHHCERDVFEAVNKRELHLGAASMAAFIYLADKYFH